MLANDYSTVNGIDLHAVIVDHKLRDESSTEIVPTIKMLSAMRIKHRVFTWDHPKYIGGNIEMKARSARYEIMTKFCREVNGRVLMTAHHSLDQWETFFMRLSRGSSVRGLSSIHELSLINEIFLVRPLLEFDPSSLKETLSERFGIENFVEDVSNKDMRFERVRWREAYGHLSEKYGLSVSGVNKSISRIQTANDCLNDISLGIASEIFDGRYIDIAKFSELHTELKIRVLNLVITKISIKNKIISYDLLRRISLLICNKTFNCTTLAGVMIRIAKGGRLHVLREERRRTSTM
jgi:tRNA(Ile)-lysidine synthase